MEATEQSPDPVAAARARAASLAVGAQPAPRHRRGWLVRRALLTADLSGLLAAFAITEAIFHARVTGGLGTAAETIIFLALLPVWVLAAKLYGLYDRDEERATHTTADDLVNVFHLVTVGVWMYYATSWLFGLTHPDQRKLASFWVLALVSVTGMRVLARSAARRHPSYVQNTLIVGAGDIGQLIGRKVLQHPEYRIRLVGFADSQPKAIRPDLGDVQPLGSADDVIDAVQTLDVDRVVVAFSRDTEEELLEVVRALRAHDVQIDVVPRLFDVVGPNSTVHSIEGLPLVSVGPARIGRSSRFVKRCVDLVGASLLLALTTPLFVVIALLIRRDSPGPVFFRQTRVGLDIQPFTLLKFRTMHVGTDEAPHREYLKKIANASATPAANNLYKLDRPDDVTRIGRLLRRTSLDELPQLVNVLRGDMSLVGPRPAIAYELELYAPHHFERFSVPAGLTGLWQVEARAHSSFGEALDLDVVYARGWSWGLDIRLLLRTPLVLLRKRETA
jgi:exopolysaccharide biosynthesis polyprenyl glycosylphosphotransferase